MTCRGEGGGHPNRLSRQQQKVGGKHLCWRAAVCQALYLQCWGLFNPYRSPKRLLILDMRWYQQDWAQVPQPGGGRTRIPARFGHLSLRPSPLRPHAAGPSSSELPVKSRNSSQGGARGLWVSWLKSCGAESMTIFIILLWGQAHSSLKLRSSLRLRLPSNFLGGQSIGGSRGHALCP